MTVTEFSSSQENTIPSACPFSNSRQVSNSKKEKHDLTPRITPPLSTKDASTSPSTNSTTSSTSSLNPNEKNKKRKVNFDPKLGSQMVLKAILGDMEYPPEIKPVILNIGNASTYEGEVGRILLLAQLIQTAFDHAANKLDYNGIPLTKTLSYPGSLIYWKEAPRIIKSFKNYTKKAITYVLVGLLDDLIKKELSVGDHRYNVSIANQLLIQAIMYIHPDVLFSRVPEPPKRSGCGFMAAMSGVDLDGCPMGRGGGRSATGESPGVCPFSGSAIKKHEDLPPPEETQSVFELIMKKFMEEQDHSTNKCPYQKLLPYIAWCALQGIKLRRSELPQIFKIILETKDDFEDDFPRHKGENELDVDSIVACKLGLEVWFKYFYHSIVPGTMNHLSLREKKDMHQISLLMLETVIDCALFYNEDSLHGIVRPDQGIAMMKLSLLFMQGESASPSCKEDSGEAAGRFNAVFDIIKKAMTNQKNAEKLSAKIKDPLEGLISRKSASSKNYKKRNSNNKAISHQLWSSIKLVLLVYFIVFCSLCDSSAESGLCQLQKNVLPTSSSASSSILGVVNWIRETPTWTTVIEPNIIFPFFVRFPSNYFFPPLEPYYSSGRLKKDSYAAVQEVFKTVDAVMHFGCKSVGKAAEHIEHVWDRTLGQTTLGVIATKEASRVLNIISFHLEKYAVKGGKQLSRLFQYANRKWMSRLNSKIQMLYQHQLLPISQQLQEYISEIGKGYLPLFPPKKVLSKTMKWCESVDTWLETNILPFNQQYVIPVIYRIVDGLKMGNEYIRQTSYSFSSWIMDRLT